MIFCIQNCRNISPYGAFMVACANTFTTEHQDMHIKLSVKQKRRYKIE